MFGQLASTLIRSQVSKVKFELNFFNKEMNIVKIPSRTVYDFKKVFKIMLTIVLIHLKSLAKKKRFADFVIQHEIFHSAKLNA